MTAPIAYLIGLAVTFSGWFAWWYWPKAKPKQWVAMDEEEKLKAEENSKAQIQTLVDSANDRLRAERAGKGNT